MKDQFVSAKSSTAETTKTAKAPVILQVLPAMQTGGVERGTVDVATASVRAGFTALVASEGGVMSSLIEKSGGRHITLPLKSKNPIRMFKNITALEKLIRDENVDVVHARSRAPAWSAYLACKRVGIPFVTTYHGTYNFTGPIKKFYNSVMQRGDRVIAITDFIAQYIMKHHQTPWGKIRTIHRGMDLEIFHPDKVAPSRVIQLATDWQLPDGVPVVMLSGRLTRWKGQPLLLQALAKIKDLPFRCLLVGSGHEEYRQELQKLAESLDIADRVQLVGECRDIAAAYMLADVVVSASTDPEAFGRVAVEGQAMGRPVVAPAHGGALEQITHGKDGWLFEPSNADDLAAKIKTALSLNDEERETIRQNSLENVKNRFTNQEMCRKTLNVYREVLGFDQVKGPNEDQD